MQHWRQGLYIQTWGYSRALPASRKFRVSASEWSDATCMAINETHLVWSPKVQRHPLGRSIVCVYPQTWRVGKAKEERGCFRSHVFPILSTEGWMFRRWKAEQFKNPKITSRKTRETARYPLNRGDGRLEKSQPHRTDCKVHDFPTPWIVAPSTASTQTSDGLAVIVAALVFFFFPFRFQGYQLRTSTGVFHVHLRTTYGVLHRVHR